MMRRKSPNHYVDGETLNGHMENLYRQAYSWRLWWLVRYSASKLRKTIISLAPSITNLLVRGKQVVIGMKKGKEVIISSPSSPAEIVNAIFNSADEDDPHAAVFQQELIIACADLIAHKTDAFDGILAIRLSWLIKAMQLLLEFFKEGMKKENLKERRRIADVKTLLDSSSLTSIAKQLELSKNSSIYDLSPTMVKELLEILMTKKNWNILTPVQTRRLNGALNRVPMNLYQRIWKILERTAGGIVIAGHHLPQCPTLKVMTQQELNFSYKIEAMMGDITQPEYRQILVEMLCILATIMERNPEISFSDTLNCDQLCQQAFQFFCADNNISDQKDMTPFYQLDESHTSDIYSLITSSGTNTTSYLLRAVMDKLLKGSNIKRKFSSLNEDAAGDLIISEGRKSEDTCHVS
uniref:Phosphorylase b kinase regulatory subunit n=1 Tax=Acrobeloides nanus TaxID=290746 RepID=A0A914ELE6_9BILA